MFDDDLLYDGEAEPGAVDLAGDVGVEDARAHIGADAGAVVVDIDDAPASLARCAHVHQSAFVARGGDGLAGVVDDVDQDAMEQNRVEGDGHGGGGQLPPEGDAGGQSGRGHDEIAAGAFEREFGVVVGGPSEGEAFALFAQVRPEIARRELGAGHSCEVAELADEPAQRADFFADDLEGHVEQAAKCRVVAGVAAVAFFDGELDGGERVFDLVREPARHFLPRADAAQEFDARAALFDFAEHGVKGAGEVGEFVAAVFGHAHREVAAAHRLRRVGECGDAPGDRTGELQREQRRDGDGHADQHREHEHRLALEFDA